MAKKTKAKGELPVGKMSLVKDPRFFEPLPPRSPLVRVAGLDLGTNCGIAWADIMPGQRVEDATLILGQWDLSVGLYDTGPLRHIRLKQFLSILDPRLLMFEDVKFSPNEKEFKGRSAKAIIARCGTSQEFLGGLKVTATTWCEERGIPAHGLNISEIKRYATGKGNANKVAMIEAANAQFGTSFETEGYERSGVDNICDAAFACAMGVHLYSEGV